MLIFWMSLKIVIIDVAERIEIVTVANLDKQDSQRRRLQVSWPVRFLLLRRRRGKGYWLGYSRRRRTGLEAFVLPGVGGRFRKHRTEELDGRRGSVIVVVAAVDEVIGVRSKLSRYAR